MCENCNDMIVEHLDEVREQLDPLLNEDDSCLEDIRHIVATLPDDADELAVMTAVMIRPLFGVVDMLSPNAKYAPGAAPQLLSATYQCAWAAVKALDIRHGVA